MPSPSVAPPDVARREADRQSRLAALALSLSLPADILLYLLLPMYTDAFGVTLAQAGMLLAANRLVRIVGYGAVARFYARHGDRTTCSLAVGAAALCALGHATLSGFWPLLPVRLLWGLAFAALNLATESLATAESGGAARRSGRSRATISLGPVTMLPPGAWLAMHWGPRAIFFILCGLALSGLFVTRRLAASPHPARPRRRGLRRPNSLDLWSFLEGLTLDGLFIVGLSYLGAELLPGGAVMMAGTLMATRYLGEILLSPLGGRLAAHFGAERLLLHLSWITAVTLIAFGCGWLWGGAALIVVLRALQLPLVAPIVAQRTPGPERVQALATRSVWRDIGAGTGPILAGTLLPVLSTPWLYGIPAVLLAASAFACARPSAR
ncbi:MAG: MFS transporter [Burkholderiaceae bacterium]